MKSLGIGSKQELTKGMRKAILVSTVFVYGACLLVTGNNPVIASEKDWRKVEEAWVTPGATMNIGGQEVDMSENLPPKFIDLNSAILTTDKYIVVKYITPPRTFEDRDGKVFVNNEKRNFNVDFQYVGINCQRTLFAYSKQPYGKPFKSSAYDYSLAEYEKIYNMLWPRNMSKLLCRRNGIRRVPHKAGQILYLNKKEKGFRNMKTLDYDKAVNIGILK